MNQVDQVAEVSERNEQVRNLSPSYRCWIILRFQSKIFWSQVIGHQVVEASERDEQVWDVFL